MTHEGEGGSRVDCLTLDLKFSSAVLHPMCFYYCSGEADDDCKSLYKSFIHLLRKFRYLLYVYSRRISWIITVLFSVSATINTQYDPRKFCVTVLIVKQTCFHQPDWGSKCQIVLEPEADLTNPFIKHHTSHTPKCLVVFFLLSKRSAPRTQVQFLFFFPSRTQTRWFCSNSFQAKSYM